MVGGGSVNAEKHKWSSGKWWRSIGKKEGGMAFVGKSMTVSVAVSYSMAFNWPAYCCQFSFRLSLSLSLSLS